MGGERADREFLVRAARYAVIGATALAVLFALFWVIGAALTPLAAAFVIAYLLDPLIDRFEARGVGRSVAIFVLLAVVGGALFAGVLVLLPTLQRELAALAERMPSYLERVATVGIPALEREIGIELPHTIEDVLARFRSGELNLPFDSIRQVITKTLATVFGTATSLVGLLVIPILAYYVLVEFDQITARLARWIPPRQRGYVLEKAATVDRLVSGFLRGQLLVAGALGLLYAVGFSVIGVDLALGVGLLAGALSLIPYLGSISALAMASLLVLLEFGAGWRLGAVVGWYAVVQLFESFVLTPRVVGQSVGLHPAVVIVALLIGGDLFGFLGLLVAVPGAAIAKVFLAELFELYHGSSLFAEADAGDDAGGSPPPAA